MSDVRLMLGDCLDLMRAIPDGSVDAVVTDPPAGIAFMGKSWDNPNNYPISETGFTNGGNRRPLPTIGRSSRNGTCRKCGRRERGWKDVEPCRCEEPDFNEVERHRKDRDYFIDFLSARLAECLRVARPGAHALVWSIPRTSHWTATAIEDAGWIIEDRISHIFGQGFPKHKSKLKPAVEDWWLCTKPGGAKWLGVDGCRIAAPDGLTKGGRCVGSSPLPMNKANGVQEARERSEEHPAGRWPTNLIFTHHPDCEPCGRRRVKGAGWSDEDNARPNGAHNTFNDPIQYKGAPRTGSHYTDPDGMETVPAWNCVEGCPVRELDLQSGERKSSPVGFSGNRNGTNSFNAAHDGSLSQDMRGSGYADSGGASRFFPTFAWQADDFAPFLYCSKASRSDRGEGNTHPTVKPQALMRWLCRLVTPEGGTVLDPFAGSGTTLLAAHAEGFRAIGMESDPESHAIAERRLAVAESSMPLLHDRSGS